MISNSAIKDSQLPVVHFNELDNGLRHVHIHVANTATFSARIGLRAGHADSDIKDAGIAHFLEHLVFAGTAKYPKRKDLYDLIDFVGGSHNASTSWHLVQYYANTLTKDHQNALEFISQIITQPLLRTEDFEREKRIITDEAKSKLSSVRYLSWQKLNQMYFADALWHTSAVGTVDQVQAITLDKITDFYNKFYTPQNAVLVTAGPIDNVVMFDQVKYYFSEWQSKTTFKFVNPKPKINNFENNFQNYLNPLAEQTVIDIIKSGPTESQVPDYSQSLADSIIGGQVFSRLYEYIREDLGPSYGLGTDFSRYDTYGMWQFGAGLDYDNIAKFSSAYRHVIDSFTTKPITEREVTQAKNDYLASVLFEVERTSSLTSIWLEDVLNRTNFKDFRSLVSAIESPTHDSINYWIKDYIEAPSKLLVTSKESVSEDLVKELF